MRPCVGCRVRVVGSGVGAIVRCGVGEFGGVGSGIGTIGVGFGVVEMHIPSNVV